MSAPRLCIDGPKRGTAHATVDDQPLMALLGPLAVTWQSPAGAPAGPLPHVTYWPHVVAVGQRCYRVWTSAPIPHGEPDWSATRALDAMHTLIDTDPHVAAACRVA